MQIYILTYLGFNAYTYNIYIYKYSYMSSDHHPPPDVPWGGTSQQQQSYMGSVCDLHLVVDVQYEESI